MSWGRPRRPHVSNKLSGKPHRRDGSDGDIQIRQTNLGAKIFGKIGSNWYDTPLSVDGIMRIGTKVSDHLAISREEITIFKDNAKVASFGEDVNLFGKIIIGKDDGTFDNNMNITIGSEQSGEGTQNICLGNKAGEDIGAACITQVLIGYHAGKEVSGVSISNICIGPEAGDTITDGDYNICIGHDADVTGIQAQNQVVIGKDATCPADNTTYLANTDIHLDASDDIILDCGSSINLELSGSQKGTFTFTGSAVKLTSTVAGGLYLQSTHSSAPVMVIAGTHVEFDGCAVGFDLETPTYNASDTDVSFITGNKQFVTFDGGNITDLNLIFPETSGNFVLLLKQDATGGRTVTNYYAFDLVNSDAADGSATVKFAGGSNPDLTDDANHVDIISIFWDADNQIAYGVASLDFQF